MPSNINSGLAFAEFAHSARFKLQSNNKTTKSVASATLFVYAVWGLGGLVCGVFKGRWFVGAKLRHR
jgi:hypothetical protein